MDNDKHWYIAIVAPNTELATAEKLSRDYEVYVPTQKTVSVWKDGRRKVRDKVVIPGKVLIHCTDKQRLESCKLSCVKRYMVDTAARPDQFDRRPVAVVPEKQVDMLKFVLEQQEANVEIDNVNLKNGDKVRVFRGALMGLEGTVAESNPKTLKVCIHIEHLCCAKIEVDADNVERIAKN